jgi:hypothetical protein
MTHDAFSTDLTNPCVEKKDSCVNCHSHFKAVRSHLTGVIITKRFSRNLKGENEPKSIVNAILDCSNTDFSELHKFEQHVGGNMIFRAMKKGLHAAYAVDKTRKLVFLRAFKNYGEYSKFLEDKKEIKNLISHL